MKSLTGDPSKIVDLQKIIEPLASLGNCNLTDLKITDTGFLGSDYTLLPAEFYDRQGSNLPDISILDRRLSVNPETAAAGKNLNLRLQDNKIGFIGDINHEQYCNLVQAIGHFPLAPLYFNKFLKLITLGANGEVKVYDGDGKEKSIDLVRNIKDDILKIRDPWRAEWLGGKSGDKKTFTYPKIVLEDGKPIIKEVTEPLEDCLMQDRSINLEDWLNNPTPQGLVRAETPVTESNKFKFWSPRNGAVPRFGAGSDRVGFVCDVHPGDSNSSLGGRAAKISSGNHG